MNFADFAALSVWPLAALLFALYFRFQKSENFKLAFSIIVGILILFPYMLLFQFIIIPQSRLAYLDLNLGAILFGGFMTGACFYAARFNPANVPRQKLFLILPLSIALGIGAITWGAIKVYGDYVQSRIVVQGRIQKLEIRYPSKAPKYYSVEINGERYYAIERDYRSLRVGDNIRAEIGQGSYYIFKIKKLGS